MKHILYATIFLVTSVFYAQVTPKNISEETTTKTIKVDDGKKVSEKTMKVTTREEQDIKFDESDYGKTDKDIILTPTKVTQTTEIDDETNPYYNSKVEVIYYKYNNGDYVFKRNENGFLVSAVNSDLLTDFGHVINTSRSNNYVFKSKDYSGVGYFDSNNNFVIEYYDVNKNSVVKEIFTLTR